MDLKGASARENKDGKHGWQVYSVDNTLC